jgi:hypothetical protein
MEKITFIYLIKLLDNKVYIGKTINIKHRELAHRKTFGSNIKLNIIDEVESLDRKDWEPLETKWIQHYINIGYNVINKRKKGGSGPEFVNDDIRKKIGDKNRCPKPEGFKNKISLALTGRKFKTSYVCTEEHKESIRKANSKPKSNETKQKISESLNRGGNLIISQKKKKWFESNNHPLIRQVLQINPNNNKIIKIWDSRSELINNGYTGIQYALSKENHIYKNSLWKYKD